MTRIDPQPTVPNADDANVPVAPPEQMPQDDAPQAEKRPNKPVQPRRPGRGGKLRLEPEEIQSHPVAGAWLDAVQRVIGADDFEWGLRTARAGRVRTLDIRAGLVSANVSEEGEGGRKVVVAVPMLSEASWGQIEERMAGEAVWTARLSQNEFPANLPDLFVDCGLTMAPGPEEELSCRVNGPAASSHRRAAAVAWLAAERYAIEPLLMLETRGCSVKQIVERIRRRRVLDLTGGSMAHPAPILPAELGTMPPLADAVEQFWRGEHGVGADVHAPGQHVPHALLRRLGPSTMEGKFPLAGLLATIYDLVSERSRAILDEEDA
ncbi:MAG: hypothetical protein P8L37_01030 [Phycisphaerales bacterium]|nr:hypothetical protein [Phycisphaerales bacterium]